MFARNILVENCTSDADPGFGFLMEGEAGPVTYCTFRNCSANNGGNYPFALWWGTDHCTVDRCTAAGNGDDLDATFHALDLGTNNTIIP
jgi:hypothetical protein